MSFSQRVEAERETIKEHFLRTFPGSFSRYTEVILKGRHRALQRGGEEEEEEEGGAKKESERWKRGSAGSKWMIEIQI